MTSPRLLDTATAALALGVHPRTIRRMVASGQLRNHGTEKVIKVRVDDLGMVHASRGAQAATRPKLRRLLLDRLDGLSAR